jgi:hypothetical protein
VRNSWGKSCKYYRPDIEAKCKDGNFWISEDELSESIDDITWIE